MLLIQEGLIQGGEIAGIPFECRIIAPAGRVANVRTRLPLQGPMGVTLHNTGNPSPTADARNHAAWLRTVEAEDRTYIGAHFFVDPARIVQTLPLDEVAWHAGDGQGPGNLKTIAIEICEVAPYTKAETNALHLAAALLNHFPQAQLYKHQDFSGKFCPRIILGEGRWPQVASRVAALRQTLSPPPDPGPAQDPSDWAKEAAAWAIDKGLFLGDGQGKYRWLDPVTREELAAILQRWARP